MQWQKLPQVIGHADTINSGEVPEAAKDQTLIKAEELQTHQAVVRKPSSLPVLNHPIQRRGKPSQVGESHVVVSTRPLLQPRLKTPQIGQIQRCESTHPD